MLQPRVRRYHNRLRKSSLALADHERDASEEVEREQRQAGERQPLPVQPQVRREPEAVEQDREDEREKGEDAGHGVPPQAAMIGRVSELKRMPPAADMRYDDEDADAVARVFVRVEWKGGRVREYETEEPQAFVMNDPEADVTLRPMRMAVQAPGSPVVPMMAAASSLRLSFRANPRRNMVIRTERTAGTPEATCVVPAEVE